MDDHSALLMQQEGLSSSHAGCLMELAAKLSHLHESHAAFEDVLHQQGQSLSQVGVSRGVGESVPAT
jgi:hypothetical protein